MLRTSKPRLPYVSYISDVVKLSKRTIYRELNRNSENGKYDPAVAHKKSQERARKTHINYRYGEETWNEVHRLLVNKLSPEQIHGRALLEGKRMPSVERIYQVIWIDKVTGGMLYCNLRHKNKRYRKRGSLKDKRGCIINRIDISKRPAIVEKKSVLGISKLTQS